MTYLHLGLGKSFVKTLRHDTYPAIDPTGWDLSGRVVFITGASRGIGRAMALSYVRSGVSGIVIAARSSQTLDEAEALLMAAADEMASQRLDRLRVLKLVLDITDLAAIARAAEEVRKIFGRLDVLVNNAAIMEPFALIAQSDENEWWRMWEINMKGTYLITRGFLPLVLESEGGLKTVVNVTSRGAHKNDPGCSSYSVSNPQCYLPCKFDDFAIQTGKLAILRFTEFIEVEYGPQGVISFSLDPGGVATEMSLKLPKELHPYLEDTAELAGDFTVWLTKERREWLSGRFVDATWDVEELEARKDDIVKGDKLKVRMVV